jgi:alcohol dehydrogenase
MKAVLTTAHGDLSVLQYRTDYPDPEPGVGEVVVHVGATALNYHDIFTRRGMPGIQIDLPVVVGSDVAGHVIATGEGVDQSWLGRRVLIDPLFREPSQPGMIGETQDGGRAEKLRCFANQLVALPDSVGLEEAASLPLAYATAWRMLVTRGQIRAGEKILILGASGGVGVACVQIAKNFGAEVIACASSADKLARLSEIGADHVIDYTKTTLRDAVRETFGKPRLDGSGGVDVAVNFTGAGTITDTQRCVKLGGRILSCGATAGYELDVDGRYWWTFEHQMIGSDGWSRDDLLALIDLVASRAIVPVIDRILPLEQAAEAEHTLEERRFVGKILLRP